MAGKPKSGKRLQRDLEFMLDGFTVKVRRWGEVSITGNRDDDQTGYERRLQCVREQVARMAADGGWNG